MIRIITDSTSDIPMQDQARLGIDIVPLRVLFGEKEYIDGVTLEKEDFYRMLAESARLPTTSQITPEGFLPLFTRYAEAGDDIIVITLSSKLSGTCQSALIARDMVGYDRIHIVDSDSVTIGQALLVHEAVRLREKGAAFDALRAHLEELKGRVRLFAMVNTLRYLKMGGRLSGTAALIGDVLGIKPIISVLAGEVRSIDKARSQGAAFQKILERVKADPPDRAFPVVFGHAHAPDMLEDFTRFITGALGPLPHLAEEIGCIVGTHTGPGCVGLAYVAQ